MKSHKSLKNRNFTLKILKSVLKPKPKLKNKTKPNPCKKVTEAYGMKVVFPLLADYRSSSQFSFTIPTQKPKTSKRIPHFPGLEMV